MKKIYTLVLTAIALCSYQFTNAQCNGVKGPNLLGAKGTFSSPAITVNSNASSCTRSGATTYSPTDNVGNALTGCSSNLGLATPCSGYFYTSKSGGLSSELTYSIVKTVGDASGRNCIKGDWKGSDHTGDGGYFMAVNGAPNTLFSSVFYQIKSIPVCIGTTYEFSAWVINLLPSSSKSAVPGSEPNISFKVNGTVIGNSGPIAYQSTPTWVKVGGSFTATTSTVDLQVVNATTAAKGNDLGLDDISINVCQSQVAVNGPASTCSGNKVSVDFVVTDPTATNKFYKLQTSVDGGTSFSDTGDVAEGTYIGSSFSVPLNIGTITPAMNGHKYRLIVSTSASGLASAECGYFNEYTVIVGDCGLLPVTLTSFNGRYSNGTAFLDWQTSQEHNSDHFDLFKSDDGQDFSLVATVKSAGTSNSIKNYSYQDNSGASGRFVYYRLKQVDIDGRAVFSSIIKLAVGAQAGVEIYPNPFTRSFNVSLSSSKITTADLQLHNSAGQIVYEKTINVNKGNNTIVLNSLPSLQPGVYYLHISNDEINYNGKLQRQ